MKYNLKTKKMEIFDLVESDINRDQFQLLEKGFDIFCHGTLGGSWEDSEFVKNNFDSKEWKFFSEFFDIDSDRHFTTKQYMKHIDKLRNTFDYYSSGKFDEEKNLKEFSKEYELSRNS